MAVGNQIPSDGSVSKLPTVTPGTMGGGVPGVHSETGINQAKESGSNGGVQGPPVTHDIRDKKLNPTNAPPPHIEAMRLTAPARPGRGGHNPAIMGG